MAEKEKKKRGKKNSFSDYINLYLSESDLIDFGASKEQIEQFVKLKEALNAPKTVVEDGEEKTIVQKDFNKYAKRALLFYFMKIDNLMKPHDDPSILLQRDPIDEANLNLLLTLLQAKGINASLAALQGMATPAPKEEVPKTDDRLIHSLEEQITYLKKQIEEKNTVIEQYLKKIMEEGVKTSGTVADDTKTEEKIETKPKTEPVIKYAENDDIEDDEDDY